MSQCEFIDLQPWIVFLPSIPVCAYLYANINSRGGGNVKRKNG